MTDRNMRSKSTLDKELTGLLAQDDLQRYLFHVFTLVALTFLMVYAVLQAQAGLTGLAILYTGAAAIIAINRWAIRFHNKLAIAANVFASLGPVVLLPWQINGGLAGTGLLWFPVYIIFVMFFVPGWGGSFWVMLTYGLSFFMLLLQLQGVVSFPFKPEVMFHFYFVASIAYALTFLFLHAQRINFDVLRLQLAAHKLAEGVTRGGNWSWNVQNDIVTWSDDVYRVFGVSPHQKITYKSYLEAVHPEDQQITKDTVQDALHDHQPYSLIHRVKRPDGTIIWVHSLGTVMLDAAGKPLRLVGTIQDITDRIDKEAELMSEAARRS